MTIPKIHADESPAANSERLEPTPRTTLRRYPARAAYERATIAAILDQGLLCHLGFVDNGQPYVIPTIYVRDGARLFIHGSPLSRMLRTAGAGLPLCLTVTLLDGLVLARSAFHHSMNYRSVVVLGTAREVTDPAEKLVAMRTLVEHLIPDRWNHTRAPSAGEIAATAILELPLAEASAKLRRGGPLDLESDYALEVWAGEIPLATVPGTPLADERLPATIALPDHVANWQSPAARRSTTRPA